MTVIGGTTLGTTKYNGKNFVSVICKVLCLVVILVLLKIIPTVVSYILLNVCTTTAFTLRYTLLSILLAGALEGVMVLVLMWIILEDDFDDLMTFTRFSDLFSGENAAIFRFYVAFALLETVGFILLIVVSAQSSDFVNSVCNISFNIPLFAGIWGLVYSIVSLPLSVKVTLKLFNKSQDNELKLARI